MAARAYSSGEIAARGEAIYRNKSNLELSRWGRETL